MFYTQLERRGLDWREAFGCVQDLGLNALRLGAYWSDIEPEHGVFDFEQLDELLHKCEAMNIQVLLTLGMKGPRWPEFHIPAWAQTDFDGEVRGEEWFGSRRAGICSPSSPNTDNSRLASATPLRT